MTRCVHAPSLLLHPTYHAVAMEIDRYRYQYRYR
eukprot:CAMPEP_0171038264 /NCGR_PEP_ID=MMETSP0736-20130129/43013_1 /TAXON_ID=186038 /ORGANISM="Fragilariopsis kerguelensis, Strain L26-C5" /LENGTH=33 /DNA_ID= /DNA_START= /DNA_END= /DNA_ORIENTATION=